MSCCKSIWSMTNYRESQKLCYCQGNRDAGEHRPYEDTQSVVLDNQASYRRPVPIGVSRACLRQRAARKNEADVLYEGPD